MPPMTHVRETRPKEIDRHFTYALTIVQAKVHVRDLIEKAFSEQLRRVKLPSATLATGDG